MAPDTSKKATMGHRAISDSAERLKAILNGSVCAIITIDEAGIVEEFNLAAERIFGYSAQEVVGKDVKMLMPDPYKGEHPQHIENYVTTGKKKILGTGRRTVGLLKSGKEFPIYLTVSEVHAVNRRIFTAMILDITEQVEAEHSAEVLREELQHVARVSAMGELASALAHEINQPLTAITNFSSAAMRVLESNDKDAATRATEYILQAGEEALRAGEIIRRLRSFIEMGETERVPQDLVSTIKEAAQLSFVGERGAFITLVWHVEDDLPMVLMDRVQIQQVFQNLIRNAVDVLHEKTRDRRIKIDIKKLGDGTILATVEDNGAGLLPEVKERLFMPFVTSKKNGMGIGLSISRNIIESHNGRIYVEQPARQGTRFCVVLPFVKNESAADA